MNNKNNELIKIDLHCHSPYNPDIILWKGIEYAIDKFKHFNVKIASFTDHSRFNLDFYLEAYQLAKEKNILLLPGVEIYSRNCENKIAHVLYIFSDLMTMEKLKELSITINKIKGAISIDKLNSIFKEFDPIIIPHVGKKYYFKYEDLNKFTFDAIEISNNAHKNYLDVLKKGLKPTSIVSFSDTHRWNIYPSEKKLLTYIPKINNEISFNNLKIALSQNKNYTKENEKEA